VLLPTNYLPPPFYSITTLHKMKYILPILFTALLLSACGKKEETVTVQIAKLKKERADIDAKIRTLEAKGGVKDSMRAVPVTATAVTPQSFQSFIDVTASITGNDNVLATPQASGTVRSVLVHAGQRVGKGQTLAMLDAAAVDQQLAAQDAQVSLLHSLYEKQQKLWAQQIGTEVQLLSAKANYEAATRQRAAIAAQRNMYRIVSPIAGVVDDVDINPGDVAMPGMKGIRIVNATKLKAEANLGESYIGKVRVGDPVTLFFPDINESIVTKLTYVAQSVDPTSRAFGVQVNLGSNAKLRPNMSAKMKIANYSADNALVVPVAAVQQTGQGQLVFVAAGKTAKAVPVQTGRTADGMIEILSGLKEGDQVITAGYEDLDNGTAIAVQ
jgi:RND family efflux transporter MFP subunit